MVARDKPRDWAEMGLEDHVKLHVGLWVVWTVVSLVMLVIGALMSNMVGWVAELIVAGVLSMYLWVTLWYLNQARLRIGATRIRRRGLRVVFWIMMIGVLLWWLAENAVFYVSVPRYDVSDYPPLFSESWMGDPFLGWGWPNYYLRVFDEPVEGVGAWMIDAVALAINLVCLSFMLWWVALFGFVGSAVAGLEDWAVKRDDRDGVELPAAESA